MVATGEQLLDRGEPSSPLGRPVAAGQHRLAQQRDQAVGLLGMPGAVRFERILGPRVHALGQAHEHLGKGVSQTLARGAGWAVPDPSFTLC